MPINRCTTRGNTGATALSLVSNTFDMLMYLYADDTTLDCNVNEYFNDIVVNAELQKMSY